MSSLRFGTTASNSKHILAAAISALLVVGIATSPAAAQHREESPKTTRSIKSKVDWKVPAKRSVVVRPQIVPARIAVVAPRRRAVGHVNVYRPFGPTIYGYGFRYTDVDAARWIGFTAITLKVLDMMEEEQIRYYEQAQIEATTAPVGEAIVWNSGGASGSVTALREGTNTSGFTCREFQQAVTINGEQETAYGTACLQADGSWRIVE